jgi:hypothetical protein
MRPEKKKPHEFFRVETIVRKIRELSPSLLEGKHPEAFARELLTNWGYGHTVSVGSAGSIAKITRDDVPIELQFGFGKYYGVAITHRAEAIFSSPDHLQEFFENRLLDLRDGKSDSDRDNQVN